MDKYYWEYRVIRKNENLKRDLPKARMSKSFGSKTEAINFSKEKKDSWLQAALFESKQGKSTKQIGAINTKGFFSEKFF
jgi:hypothetical protein